jgi:phage N-6-adenine-methyltransferase
MQQGELIFVTGQASRKSPKKRGRPRVFKLRVLTDAERSQRYRQRLKRCERPRSQIWETPQDTFNEWDARFHFTLDVCALPENAKCARYFTPAQDGLQQDWSTEICWCNPPYTRYAIDRWVRKAYEASKAGATVVCLLPVSTTSRWWRDYIRTYAEVIELPERLKFGGSKVNARFDNVVAIFRPPIVQ